MQVLPIASGKGGVGKSLIATNLAIALAEAGKRVHLVDLDLGGSNLHLMLGIQSKQAGIGGFLSGDGRSFADCVVATEYSNLSFVPGDSEIPGLANLTAAQKRRIIRGIRGIASDYVVLDLGAGTSFNIIDFFLVAGRGLVVSTPTPTATVNAYLFLKNAVFRIINSVFKRGSAGAKLLDQLRHDTGAMRRMYIPTFLEEVRRVDAASHSAYMDAAARFRPRLLLNMLEDPKDAEKAGRIRRSCQQYLGLDLEHLGVLYRDDLQDVALGSRLPIIRYKPSSVLSQALYRIADKLIQADAEGDSPLDFEALEQSFQTADMEATVDFDAKMDYVEELLHSGALTMGDLLETVKTQQFEIQQLRKETQLLKSKLVRTLTGGAV